MPVYRITSEYGVFNMTSATELSEDEVHSAAGQIVNSMYNRPYAKPGPYVTQLGSTDEGAYRRWLDDLNKQRGGEPLNPDDQSYDMRGFWKGVQEGRFQAPTAEGAHFPDVFKTPAHPFFSRESIYAEPMAPYWQPVPPLSGASDVLMDPTTGQIAPAMQEEIAQRYPENAARDALVGASGSTIPRYRVSLVE